MRRRISRISAWLALMLPATAPTTFAQLWTSPTIPPEVRDRWCRDVGAPIGSPPLPPSPYKVGSNELPFCSLQRRDITPPELLEHPDPVYTGSVPENYAPAVVLGVFVGTGGQPLSIRVGRSAGYGLDEAALEEVKKWRWRPATKDGQPVAVQTTVQVKFRLVQSSAKP
jgi:TonB family protein